MTNGFDINLITGKAKDIAHNVDNKNVKDGKLSGKEISVFLAECKQGGIDIEKEPWYQKFSDFLRQSLSNFKPKEYVAERDATYVAPKANAVQAIPAKTEHKKKLPLQFSSNSNIRTDYDWSEEEFSKILDRMLNNPRYKGKFKNSVLQGKAKAFIEAGKKYNIDPRILVAIAMCESSRGTSEKARKLNNIGGLKINGKFHHFENVEASIDSIAKTINTRCKEGYTTPQKVANSGRYCGKSEATQWLSNVNSYLGVFNKYYHDTN